MSDYYTEEQLTAKTEAAYRASYRSDWDPNVITSGPITPLAERAVTVQDRWRRVTLAALAAGDPETAPVDTPVGQITAPTRDMIERAVRVAIFAYLNGTASDDEVDIETAAEAALRELVGHIADGTGEPQEVWTADSEGTLTEMIEHLKNGHIVTLTGPLATDEFGARYVGGTDALWASWSTGGDELPAWALPELPRVVATAMGASGAEALWARIGERYYIGLGPAMSPQDGNTAAELDALYDSVRVIIDANGAEVGR